MSAQKRYSSLVSLLKAPFYLGFLLLLYIVGRSGFDIVNNFALSLGFSAAAVRASGYALYALYFFICAVVLAKLFCRDD